MARNPRKATAAGSGGKARKSPAKARQTKKTSTPSKPRAPAKNLSTRKKSGSAAAQPPQNWSGAIEALVNSSLGRSVLADVLEAAAGALRKARQGIDDAVEASTSAASTATGTAVEVGTEVASGAAALVQTATQAMADIATATAQNFLAPGADDADRKRRTARKREAE